MDGERNAAQKPRPVLWPQFARTPVKASALPRPPTAGPTPPSSPPASGEPSGPPGSGGPKPRPQRRSRVGAAQPRPARAPAGSAHSPPPPSLACPEPFALPEVQAARLVCATRSL
ncbi:unnamed protein product [Rangifer tarandus platyrhynchus]|uniref:Uncharacterized protein n=2 Tax=Rangifer tarandus platyrhynchus TaxID=3082113 RepID=A0ABN8ZYH3_RANTA|nr:unnamed protein product [Rangifer tarandus platyrhynchus]CAI9711690.1 unnamed protein product [Rangifer tarandus platyrhynchus]